jgi:hypothetical protein
LIFVADEIPDELRTIVEFLNEQLTQIEVLAVEVKRYKGDGLSTLVSSMIGDTAKAKETKGVSPRRDQDRQGVLSEMEAELGTAVRTQVEDFLAWAEARDITIRLGNGQTGSLLLVLPGRDRGFLTLYADGRVFFDQVRHYLKHAPFDDPSIKAELLNKLDGLKPGAHSLRDDTHISGYPLTISVADIVSPPARKNLETLLDWVLDRMELAPHGTDGGSKP